MISRSAIFDFTLLFTAFAIKNKKTIFQISAVPFPKFSKSNSSISFSIVFLLYLSQSFRKEIALFYRQGGKVTSREALQ